MFVVLVMKFISQLGSYNLPKYQNTTKIPEYPWKIQEYLWKAPTEDTNSGFD